MPRQQRVVWPLSHTSLQVLMGVLSNRIKRMAPGVFALAAVLLCAQIVTQLAHAADHAESVCTACVCAQTTAAGAPAVTPIAVADYRVEYRSAPAAQPVPQGRHQLVAQQRAPPPSR